MARTFNGNIWGGIGDKVARDAMIRREENKEALGGLLDMAKFLEKANANRKLREDWQKYFEDRKSNADAALADEDAAEAEMIDNALALEDMYGASNAANVFGIEEDDGREGGLEGSLWDPVGNLVRYGFDPASAGADREFMATFDPSTATDEEIRRAQAIVGTKVDGDWRGKSRKAYNKYMGV